MTALPRNILFGSLVMLAALAAASCSSEDSGQTLTVTAVPSSPQTVNSSTDIKASPIVSYRGKKELDFNWSVELPVGGQVAVTDAATKTASFNFKNPGSYKVILRTQEVAGTIANTSSGTYIVVVNPVSATGPDVTVSLTPSITTPTAGTGSLVLTIAGGVAPYTVAWTSQNSTNNGVTLTLTGTTQTTSGTGATKTFAVLDQANNGNKNATFIASGTVTDANGVVATFEIGIIVALGVPG